MKTYMNPNGTRHFKRSLVIFTLIAGFCWGLSPTTHAMQSGQDGLQQKHKVVGAAKQTTKSGSCPWGCTISSGACICPKK